MECTREQLIKICEKAFVEQKKWINRDSASSQIQLGQCYALLKAGCEYEIQYTKDGKGCSTNDRTIWLQLYVYDFDWFENGESNDKRGNTKDYHYYLPTEKCLKESSKMDWY